MYINTRSIRHIYIFCTRLLYRNNNGMINDDGTNGRVRNDDLPNTYNVYTYINTRVETARCRLCPHQTNTLTRTHTRTHAHHFEVIYQFRCDENGI